MNCSEAREQLSQYYDGELPPDVVARVEQHLESCAGCSREMETFRSLSTVTVGMAQPEPPSDGWDKVARELDGIGIAGSNGGVRTSRAVNPTVLSRGKLRRRLTLVASLLVALGVVGFFLLQHDHGKHELAVDFDRYLDDYATDPDKAAATLFASYPSEEVDAETAIARVGYRPVALDSLPDGYTVASTHLLKMPCCTCVKTVCRNSSGRSFVIFEHDAEQPVWFGNRTKRECECGGTPATVTEFDSQLAATWRVGNRSVTLVGARDMADVMTLVPQLSGSGAQG